MLVVMQPNASAADIDKVCDEIVRQGFKPLPMPGAVRTAIGLLGDDAQVDWSYIEGLPGVANVLIVQKPYRQASREWKNENTIVEIAPGVPVEAWSPGDGPVGPTIRVRTGDTARITLENALNEPTILHWHGLRVPEIADGHPRLAIPTGATYRYEFPVIDRAGTYWYHAHPHHRTGVQTYRGMVGLLVIGDEAEDATLFDTVRAVGGMLHVSLDVDFLDPSIAPAVGTTVPGGTTSREAHLVMELLHESGLVTSLDLVELNPFLDERGRTAKLMVDLVGSLMGRKVFDRPTRSY